MSLTKKTTHLDYMPTRLVAAMVTQIFLYMIDSGFHYGYICTGEALVFLHNPKINPTIVQNIPCVSRIRMCRTMNCASTGPLPAKCMGSRFKRWPSNLSLEMRSEVRNARARARCQPVVSTPKHSSTEGSGNIKYPDWKPHYSQRHSIGLQEFTHHFHCQLAGGRVFGFEQLHTCGRTENRYLGKKQHRLQAEGQHIPWYHGRRMTQKMILSRSGTRLQHARNKALAEICSCGATHCDSEWRNMLWDDLSGHLVVVDLEDMKWLKRPGALDYISDSTQRTRCVGAMKYKPGFKKVEYTVNSMAVSQALPLRSKSF
ncbi:hypothetical protein BDQ94DRAFT_186124 [Aspergillus welwitschiae]|uniref:Aminoglycoside phosphotransferase domain-containing protein n=1 Tax=Aspergillus welwitschiae TaxID=1341132 RepID=A0A3F3PIR3_9EURO|nr:hypothetical protein BDQ94DRAFT_186124 [Aspergillus welwitschiae]RDH26819.1 hypothetical protein BDQ94DRAFT_186124 [Aspergillus welwitschiae]